METITAVFLKAASKFKFMAAFFMGLFMLTALNSNAQCDYTLEVSDTWGDGWNGASSVVISANGNPILTVGNAEFSTGNNASFNFQVNTGDDITAAFTGGTGFPDYADECGYRILDASGVELVNRNYNATGPPADITTGTIAAACPACLVVSNLSSTAVSGTSASFEWTPESAAVGYIYSVNGQNQGPDMNNLFTTTDSFATVTGLSTQTNYDFYVATQCAGDTSAFVSFSFTTPCAAFTNPFLESFSSGNLPSSCWRNFSLGGGTSTNDLWKFGTGVGFGAINNGKPTGTYAWVDGSSPAGEVSVLETPLIDMTGIQYPQLKFELFSNNEFSANNPETANMTFVVRFWDGANWNDSIYVYQDNNPNWFEVTVDLFNYTITGPVQFQFMVDQTTATSSSAFYNDILLDEVQVLEAPFDVSLNGFVTPTNPVTAGFQNVSVEVSNLAPIAINQLNIRWFRNGVQQPPVNLALSPAMASGETRTITLGGANLTTAPFELSAFILSVDGVTDDNQANDTIAANFCGPINGTFTVGGAGADFPTFDDVLGALDCGIDGPITFNINPGTYGRVEFGEVFGASATNTITFDGGDVDDVLFTHAVLQEPTIVMDGADHFVFKNVTIEHSSSTGLYAHGVQLKNAANGNTFEACKFTMPSSTSSNRSHIAATAVTNTSTISTSTASATNGDNANDLVVRNCEFIDGYHAVVVRGIDANNQAQNITIENCTMANYGYSIYTFAVNGLTIRDNNISNAALSMTTYRAVYNYFGSNYTFRSNEVATFYNGFENINTDNGLIVNNAIYSSGSTSTAARGIQSSGSSNLVIQHNSVYSGANGAAAYFTTTTGLDVRNNIFVGSTNFAVQSFASASYDELDYNLVYREDGGNEISIATQLGTFTSLADAQLQGLALNSFSGDPLFISNTNLKSNFGTLQNNSGQALGVALDIEGNQRDALNPDMGAYEYTPLSLDLAVTSIDKPGNCFVANDSITVTLTNTTPSSIDFANNSFSIFYEVTGAATSMGSATVNADTVAPFGDFTVQITGIDFSAVGTYDITAYIVASFDDIASNDTLSSTIEFDGVLNVSASNTNVTDPTEVVDLEASTPFVNFFFKITEIGQWNGTATGRPTGGTPSFMNGDDYIEITGPPNTDMVGYTFEKWSSTSATTPNVVHTFAPGSFLSPDGTLILETFGGTVDSPSDFLYVASTQSGYSSGGYSANVLKDPDGNIVDAVLYSTSTIFNPNTGVTTEWSGAGTNGSSSWGIRLEGPDTDDNTNWVQANGGVVQDPNVVNTGLTPDMFVEAAQGTAFAWFNALGDTISTNLAAAVGPFDSTGTHLFYFNLLSACGNYSDTVVINSTIIQNDVGITAIVSPTNDCNKDTLPLIVTVCNFGANTVYNIPVTADINGQIVPAGLIDSIPGVTCEDIFLFDIPVPSLPATADITVWTALGGDSDNSNDTTSVMNITVDAPPADPLTTNDTSCTGNGAVTATGNDIFWFNTAGEYIDFGNTYTFDGLTMNDTVLAVDARPTDKVIITEIGQFNGATAGQPAAGRPSYLNGDDYVEITGPANGDLEGYTFEKWSSTSATTPNVVHTFAPGSFLSPDGTLILETFGGTVDSPSDFLYVANTQSSYGSSSYSANVLRDPDGNIVDAVLFSTSTIFNPNTGVTTEWSGAGTNGTSSWGIRLEGPDTDDNTNWMQATGTILQDPNVRNDGVVTIIPDLTCASNAIQAIFYYNAITIDSIVVADVSACGGADGSITVFASGNDVLGNGFQYSIDGGQTFQGANTFTNLSASPVGYDIVVTNGVCDENGGNVQVGQPDAPPAPTVPMDTAVCSGFFGAYTLNVVPDSGTSVVWYTSPALTTPVATGNSVTPADNPGVVTYYVVQEYPQPNCVSTASTVTVEVFPIPAAPSIMGDTACLGEMVSLNAMGNNVVWSDDLAQNNVLQTGNAFNVPDVVGTETYYVSYEDANGCQSAVGSFDYTRLNSPSAPTVTPAATICEGDIIPSFTASGSGGTLTWYSNMALTNVIATGGSYTPGITSAGYEEFYVTESSANGCESMSAMSSLTINAVPANAALGADVNYCQGDVINALSGVNIPGTTLEWYADAALTSPLGTGSITPANTVGATTYYAVRSNGLCQSPVDNIVVTITAAPANPVVSASANSACEGTTVPALSATGSGIEWYTDAALTNAFGSGSSISAANTVGISTYYAIATDNGCSSTGIDSVSVEIYPSVSVSAVAQDVTNCVTNDGEVTLTETGGTGPFSYAINGGSPQGNNVFTALAVGTYVPSVSDANGCVATGTAVNVGAADQPSAPVNATTDATTYCQGDALGFIKFTAASGTLNYYDDAALTNSIGTGDSIAMPNTVGANTYYATAIFNGCESAPTSITITINATPATPNASADVQYCFGDVLQPITVTGGAGTFNWYRNNLSTAFGTGTSRTPQFALGTTKYYVTETQNGCVSMADSVEVTILAVPTPTVAAESSCDNEPTNALVANGGANSAFNWYADAGTSNLLATGGSYTPSADAAGVRTFYLLETDDNNCTNNVAVAANYTTLESPAVAVSASDISICDGEDVTLTYTGNANSIAWNHSASTMSSIVESPSSTTTYVVTGTANNGCSNTDNVQVVVFDTPSADLGTDFDVPYSANAALQVAVTGGTAPFSYSWSPDTALSSNNTDTTTLFNVTSIRTINVTVTDDNNCSAEDNITITPLGGPLGVSVNTPATICPGDEVSLLATAFGGTTTYTYSWSPAAGLNTASGDSVVASPNTTTTYTVSVNDGVNIVTADVIVNVYNPDLVTVSADQSICVGDTAILVAGGVANLNWSTTATSDTIIVSPTSTTTYWVEGVDANNCPSSDTVTVTVNPLPTLTASSSNDTICDGENIVLTASGAQNYSWTDLTAGTNAGTGASINASPSVTTQYELEGTDNNGCVNITSVTVEVLALPNVTATSDSVCAGNQASSVASGAVSYLWSDGTVGANLDTFALTSFTVTVTGTAANGCTADAVANFEIRPSPTANAGNDQTVCAGTNVVINASGAGAGGTYMWNTGVDTNTFSFTASSDTQFVVSVTNQFGCPDSDTVEITVVPLPQVDLGADAEICLGDTLSVAIAGNADVYVWNDAPGQSLPNRNLTPSTTTTYVVTAQSFSPTLCINRDTLVVTVNSLPVVATNADATICLNDDATISASGADVYNWVGLGTGASQIVSPAATTTYTVIGTDTTTGCQNTDDIIVSVNSLPAVNIGNDRTQCFGDVFTLNAGSTGNTYAWSTGGNASTEQVTADTTGNIFVIVTDNNNCSNIDSMLLTVNPLPSLTTTADTAICVGSTMNVSTTGATNYVWSNNNTSASFNVTPSTTTTYTVTATDANSCVSIDSVVVTVNSLPTLTVLDTATFCQGTSASLIVSGAATYSWSNGLTGDSITVDANTPALLSVVGTDLNGCSSTEIVNVVQLAGPTVNAGAPTSFCQGSGTSLTATGNAASYEWMGVGTGATVNVNPATSRYYVVTGTAANACTSTDSVFVTVNDRPVVDAGMDITFCQGSTTTLTATAPTAIIFAWSTGASTASINVSPTSSQNYMVTVTDNNGCTNTDDVNINVNMLPNVVATSDVPSICLGGDITLNAAGAVSYSWSTGAQGSNTIVTTTAAGNNSFTVTGTDTNGCVNTAIVSVNVFSLPTIVFNNLPPVCLNTPAINLSGAQPSGGTFTGNGVSNNTFDPSVAGAGVTTITYTFTNNNGCTNDATADVEVLALPNVALAIDDLCENELPFNLAGTGTPTGGVFSGDIVGTSLFNPAGGAGTYSVTYTFVDPSTSCSNSATESVLVNPSPVVDLGGTVELTNGTALLDAGTSGDTYSWSTGETTQTITVNALGSFSVTVTNNFGCEGSDDVEVIPATGLAINGDREISLVYMPNPTSGNLTLEATNLVAGEFVHIRLMDMNGKLVHDERLSTPDNAMVHHFDFTKLNAGVYFIQLITEDKAYTNRIIIR